MSGHSKWATIHKDKEANDAKKGAVFTKLAAAITVAVKQGGGIGDPEQNFRLRLVIDQARQFNMPKDNVARAIEKGMGGGAGGVELIEALFEGFLPGGVAVMVEAVTDNKLRTAQKIKEVIDKNGGTMASSGAVSYLFSHLGELVIELGGRTSEEAELVVIDLGATDVEIENDHMIVFCEKEKTFDFKQKLEVQGYVVKSAELVMRPNSLVEVANNEMREQLEKILNLLEGLDDVSHVWTNYA